MTQVLQLVASEAPQLINQTNEALYIWSFVFTVLAMIAVFITVLNIVLDGEDRKRSQFVFAFITFSLAIAALVYGVSGISHNTKSTRANVSQAIEDKYGVKVLDPKDVYGTDDPKHIKKIPRFAIPAFNPEGERIQITIELTEDGTDVIAFSSGAEMAKIAE